MKNSIKIVTDERVDQIEFNLTHTNKNYFTMESKFESIKLKLEAIVPDEAKELIGQLIDVQKDKEILVKEEIYKKAFKDGLTFKDYL